MKEIDDERWREASRQLSFDLVDADGDVVPTVEGTLAHKMRGRVDGRRVRMRYGSRDIRDRTTAVDVTLHTPLLLGLSAQSYLDPAPRSNRYGVVPRRVFSSIEAIEGPRGEALFADGVAGTELAARFGKLASVGWVELTDTRARVQGQVFVDGAAGWVSLVRSCVAVASLAERAREELAPAPWETRLLANLDAERERLGFRLTKRAFLVEGMLGKLKASVRLETHERRYALAHRLAFPAPLPEGCSLSRRARPVPLLARLFGRGRAGAAQDSLEASDFVRERLSAMRLEALAELSAKGEVALDEEALTFRSFDIEAPPGPVLDFLASVGAELAQTHSHPYRSSV